ncbi:hypothetical protein [Rothia kristinae]
MARKHDDERPEQVADESTQPVGVDDPTAAPEGDSKALEAVEDQTPTEDTEAPENGADGVSEGDPEDDTEDDAEGTPEGDTFPRAYVEKLRKEAADARVKAGRAEELAAALWEARVTSLGRLADPTDLPMPEGVDPMDLEAVAAAVDELLARKPHLASRVPRGDVGAGVVSESAPFSLGGMIRAAAR